MRRIRAEWKERNPPASERLRQPNNPQNSRSHIRHEGTRNGATDQQTKPRIQNQSSNASWMARYPCLHPVNPHMKSISARAETFGTRNGNRWPQEKLRATTDELVNAGFFHLGERDRVKCWYCNGGLQNWDYEDDPWREHAKWFPR